MTSGTLTGPMEGSVTSDTNRSIVRGVGAPNSPAAYKPPNYLKASDEVGTAFLRADTPAGWDRTARYQRAVNMARDKMGITGVDEAVLGGWSPAPRDPAQAVPADPTDPRRRMAAQHRRSMPGGPGAGGYGGGGGSVSSYVNTIAELRTSVALHAHIKRGKAEAREVGGLQLATLQIPLDLPPEEEVAQMAAAFDQRRAVLGPAPSSPARVALSPADRALRAWTNGDTNGSFGPGTPTGEASGTSLGLALSPSLRRAGVLGSRRFSEQGGSSHNGSGSFPGLRRQGMAMDSIMARRHPHLAAESSLRSSADAATLAGLGSPASRISAVNPSVEPLPPPPSPPPPPPPQDDGAAAARSSIVRPPSVGRQRFANLHAEASLPSMPSAVELPPPSPSPSPLPQVPSPPSSPPPPPPPHEEVQLPQLIHSPDRSEPTPRLQLEPSGEDPPPADLPSEEPAPEQPAGPLPPTEPEEPLPTEPLSPTSPSAAHAEKHQRHHKGSHKSPAKRRHMHPRASAPGDIGAPVPEPPPSPPPAPPQKPAPPRPVVHVPQPPLQPRPAPHQPSPPPGPTPAYIVQAPAFRRPAPSLGGLAVQGMGVGTGLGVSVGPAGRQVPSGPGGGGPSSPVVGSPGSPQAYRPLHLSTTHGLSSGGSPSPRRQAEPATHGSFGMRRLTDSNLGLFGSRRVGDAGATGPSPASPGAQEVRAEEVGGAEAGGAGGAAGAGATPMSDAVLAQYRSVGQQVEAERSRQAAARLARGAGGDSAKARHPPTHFFGDPWNKF